MKTIISFLVLLAFFSSAHNSKAQARNLTRRIVNPDNTLATPNGSTPPAPPVKPVVAPAVPQVTQTNVAPQKTQEQKDELLRKTIEFQKKKAEEGAPSAQYDLGMRYLNGNGLGKDLDLAKKWLTAASTNGNAQALKKLEELKKREAARTPVIK
ncbi:MAG: hypothetical protein ABI042_14860 [Verrucomicrobiota bacterium]